MKTRGAGLTGLFRRLLGLFPAGYRREFGAEQLEVLEMALAERAAEGRGALARLWIVELLSLPGAALRAHLRERRGMMDALPANLFVEKPAGRGEALLAGLPHLLWALANYLPVILGAVPGLLPESALAGWAGLLKGFAPTRWALYTLARPSYWLDARVFYQSVLWGFALLVIACLAAGWRRGWPRWSASWLGYGLLVLFNGLITVFPDGRIAYPMGVLWVALTLGVFIWQARRSLLGGMLAVLPFSHMLWWYLGLDGVKGTLPEAFGYIAAGLLLMLATAAALRSGRLGQALGLALAVGLLVGLGVSYGEVYHSNAFSPPDPSLGRVVLQSLGGLASFAFFGLPLWGVLLWRWRKQRPAR